MQGDAGDTGSQGQRGDPGADGNDATGSSGLIEKVFTKWGSNDCPSGTNIVYIGRAGASYHNNAGGGSNLVCLHPTYSYDGFTQEYRSSTFGSVVGVEYVTTTDDPLISLNNENVPCAVCAVQSDGVYMQPGKTTCETGWTSLYTGYIMSEREATVTGRTGENFRSEFVCVMSPGTDVVMGLEAPGVEASLSHVHVDCTNAPNTEILDCGQYTAPLACVVCRKA